jgi:hypothetical protein
MVYDTQNYLGSGLCPLSGIKTLEHDASETGSVSKMLCSGLLTPDSGQSPEPSRF